MRHIRQRQNSNQCGQACVAMLVGCSISTACERMRRQSCTSTKDLVRALRANGLRVAPKLAMWRREKLPHTAILKVKFADRTLFHWVVKLRNRIFDPMKFGPVPFGERLWRRRRGRVTSYLAVSGSPHAQR